MMVERSLVSKYDGIQVSSVKYVRYDGIQDSMMICRQVSGLKVDGLLVSTL